MAPAYSTRSSTRGRATAPPKTTPVPVPPVFAHFKPLRPTRGAQVAKRGIARRTRGGRAAPPAPMTPSPSTPAPLISSGTELVNALVDLDPAGARDAGLSRNSFNTEDGNAPDVAPRPSTPPPANIDLTQEDQNNNEFDFGTPPGESQDRSSRGSFGRGIDVLRDDDQGGIWFDNLVIRIIGYLTEYMPRYYKGDGTLNESIYSVLSRDLLNRHGLVRSAMQCKNFIGEMRRRVKERKTLLELSGFGTKTDGTGRVDGDDRVFLDFCGGRRDSERYRRYNWHRRNTWRRRDEWSDLFSMLNPADGKESRTIREMAQLARSQDCDDIGEEDSRRNSRGMEPKEGKSQRSTHTTQLAERLNGLEKILEKPVIIQNAQEIHSKEARSDAIALVRAEIPTLNARVDLQLCKQFYQDDLFAQMWLAMTKEGRMWHVCEVAEGLDISPRSSGIRFTGLNLRWDDLYRANPASICNLIEDEDAQAGR